MKKTTPATSGSRSLLPEIETEPKLTKRQMLANMASGGVISPNMSAWVAAWAKRSRFNPIRMLTPDLLSRQIDNFQMGYLRDFALMAEAIKRRDYMVQTSTRKREKAISRHGIDVITNDHIEKELKDQAKLHASALTYFYDNLHARNVMEQDQAGGKRLLIQQMMEAVYYRYAVHEIVWRPSVDPVTGAARLTADFNYVPLYFFETQTAHLRFLKRYFGTIMGDEMEQGEWLVTVADGIAEAIAVCYMFKTMPLKDWVSFSERFGTPGILGKTKAAFNSQQWKEMEDALRKFAQDWTAVTAVDNGIELIIPQGSTGNNTVFAPLVELMDKAIATICRGADLSTISSGHQSQGHGSSLQGGEGNLMEQDDAELITETLHQIDEMVIARVFPGEDPLAYAKISVPDTKTVADTIARIGGALSWGVKISVAWARNELAIPEPEEDEECLTPPAPTAGGAPSEEDDLLGPAGKELKDPVGASDKAAAKGDDSYGNAIFTPALANLDQKAAGKLAVFRATAMAKLSNAQRTMMAPVITLLQNAATMNDDVQRHTALAKLRHDMPALFKRIAANPALANALNEIYSTALVSAIAEAAAARAVPPKSKES